MGGPVMEPITVDFTYTKEDYVGAVRRFLRLNKTFSRFSQISMFIALLVDLVFIAQFGFSFENMLLTVLLICTFLMLALLYWQPVWIYNRNPRLHAPQHYVFRPEGIAIQTALSSSQLEWALFTCYWDDQVGVYLLQSKKNYVVIPARCFSGGQRAALKEMALGANPSLQYRDLRPAEK